MLIYACTASWLFSTRFATQHTALPTTVTHTRLQVTVTFHSQVGPYRALPCFSPSTTEALYVLCSVQQRGQSTCLCKGPLCALCWLVLYLVSWIYGCVLHAAVSGLAAEV